MTDQRSGQFGVLRTDGLRIDRLPVGWAAGHWWIPFVFSGVDFQAGRPSRSSRMWHEIPDLLRLDAGAGRITLPPTAGGDGGFSGECYWVQYQFTDDLRRLEVSYLEAGAAVASETLVLS